MIAALVRPSNFRSGHVRMTAAADLAIVVLSHRAPGSLIEAVASASAQHPPAEVIVVNSGGGEAARLLREAGLEASVIEHPGRLLPGGARNLGIARARYIAFLADDCRAEPGWAAARLAAHAQGAAAVASALVCDRPERPVALAGQLSLFVRRLPGTPVSRALAYGASYDRRLFDVHGLFRDDLRGGEDTEFHQRLAPTDRPVWTPAVRTVHRSPATLREFFADQHRRGRRTARAWNAIDGRTRWSVARAAIGRVRSIWVLAPRATGGEHPLSLLFALPLIAIGAGLYALGAMRANQSADD